MVREFKVYYIYTDSIHSLPVQFGHKFNPVYQRFCVNYEKQQGFVRVLQQLPDFQIYQNVCRGHSVVGKNDLAALLIAPMQHQCRYQLKLDVRMSLTHTHSHMRPSIAVDTYVVVKVKFLFLYAASAEVHASTGRERTPVINYQGICCLSQ